MVVTWKTRNIRSLFSLKDKNDYKSCVIYKGGSCSCGSRYIGETKRNVEVRWNNIIQLKVRTIKTRKQHQPLFYMDYHFKCSKKY